MIRKVDGRSFLDSGTIIVSGDAVVEVDVEYKGRKHEIALKFRTKDGEEPDIQFGNPRPDRTVIHFVNFPKSQTVAADGFHVGKIGDEDLRLYM